MSEVVIKSFLGEYKRKVLFGPRKEPGELFEKELIKILSGIDKNAFEKRLDAIVTALFETPDPSAVRGVAAKFLMEEIDRAQDVEPQMDMEECKRCEERCKECSQTFCNSCKKSSVKYVPCFVDKDGGWTPVGNKYEDAYSYTPWKKWGTWKMRKEYD